MDPIRGPKSTNDVSPINRFADRLLPQRSGRRVAAAEAKAEFKRLRELLNATTEARREERALA